MATAVLAATILITQDPGRIDRRSAGPKLTMLVQSALSLVIAILVIARAINVLPG
ncbi:MAG: hypothetical protein ACJ75N_19070 [Actinomycetes bacterium]|jgi:hypothetical protein